MSVDITQVDYAGVWRESWPKTSGSNYGIVPDLSRNGRHAITPDASLAWVADGDSVGRYSTDVTVSSMGFAIGSSTPYVRAFSAIGTLDGSSGNAGLWQQGDKTDGAGVYIRNSNQFRVILYASGAVQVVQYLSPTNLNDGVRRHFSASWDGSIVKLWLSGTLVHSETQTVVPLSSIQGGRIGTAYILANSGIYTWHGTLADVLARQTAWTQSEIDWLSEMQNDLRSVAQSDTPRIISPYLVGDVG